MDNVPEENYPGDSPETLQRKLYCLLEQLQSFHQKLEPCVFDLFFYQNFLLSICVSVPIFKCAYYLLFLGNIK